MPKRDLFISSPVRASIYDMDRRVRMMSGFHNYLRKEIRQDVVNYIMWVRYYA